MGKKGYSRHPETLRWRGRLEALKVRHDLLVSEMRLRGYKHHSPVTVEAPPIWPSEFIDPPGAQLRIERPSQGLSLSVLPVGRAE